MTRTEFNKLDYRKLTDEAREILAISDQNAWEFFKDLDKDDYKGISERTELLKGA